MAKKIVFKVLLLGPAAVGKTSLLHRFVKNMFAEKYTLTIGVEFLAKDLKIEKKKIRLTIWDIGGQKRFKFLHERFYKGTRGILLIFDLTNYQTFEEMEEWLSEAYEILGEKIPFVLIGNKSDLLDEVGDVVDSNEARKFAEDKGSIYIETSAKTGENVEEGFTELTKRMLELVKANGS